MLNFITPNVKVALRRFPVSILCAFALYISYLLSRFEDVVIFIPCSFFFFGIGRLLAETHGWKLWKEALFGIVGGVGGTFLLSATTVAGSPQAFMLSVLLFVGVAPFIGRRFDDFSFWFFNRQLWGGAALACLAAIILIGGIYAILASVKYLFGIPIDNKIFGHVFAFGCIVYAPIATLAAVPEKFDAKQEECGTEQAILFLLNWILAPLAIAYFLILYAYGVKMAVLWEMPKGQVASIVAGFGALGIATYLIGWPLRDVAKRHVNFLYKYYFTLLLPPAILMAGAIAIRIHEYGLTEDRYLVALMAAWFLGLGALYTVVRAAPIKIIMISLMILMFGASFGPWGIVSLSQSSQISILKDVLERNNMLQDGRAVPRVGDITVDDEKKISSIVYYLTRQERLGRAAMDLFPPELLQGEKRYKRLGAAPKITSYLNVRHVAPYEMNKPIEGGATKIDFYAFTKPNAFDVSGYDVVYTNVMLDRNGADVRIRRPLIVAEQDGDAMILHNNEVFFEPAGAEPVPFNIATILPSVINAKTADNREPITLTAAYSDKELKLVIRHLELDHLKDGTRIIRGLHGHLLIKN